MVAAWTSMMLVVAWMACQVAMPLTHGAVTVADGHATESAISNTFSDQSVSVDMHAAHDHDGAGHGDHSDGSVQQHCASSCFASIVHDIAVLSGSVPRERHAPSVSVSPASFATKVLIPPPNVTL